VPHKYIPTVLGVTYRARQLYDELVVNIRANGEEAMLKHLIDWVCAACTLTFDANHNPAPPVTLLANGLMRPGLDEKLAAHIRDKVYADVPALNPRQFVAQGGTQVSQIMAGFLQDRQLAAGEREAPSPSTTRILGESYPSEIVEFPLLERIAFSANLGERIAELGPSDVDRLGNKVSRTFKRCSVPESTITADERYHNELMFACIGAIDRSFSSQMDNDSTIGALLFLFRRLRLLTI
jgi:hypothetical protein